MMSRESHAGTRRCCGAEIVVTHVQLLLDFEIVTAWVSGVETVPLIHGERRSRRPGSTTRRTDDQGTRARVAMFGIDHQAKIAGGGLSDPSPARSRQAHALREGFRAALPRLRRSGEGRPQVATGRDDVFPDCSLVVVLCRVACRASFFWRVLPSSRLETFLAGGLSEADVAQQPLADVGCVGGGTPHGVRIVA